MSRRYEPPEYQSFGRLSEKTDAYAYGIVLLELLTGRGPMQAMQLRMVSRTALGKHPFAFSYPASCILLRIAHRTAFKPHTQDEPDLFTHMEGKYLDRHAGRWPPGTAQAVVEVCQGCMQYDVHSRLTVKQALPRLLAACSASGVRVPSDEAGTTVPPDSRSRSAVDAKVDGVDVDCLFE